MMSSFGNLPNTILEVCAEALLREVDLVDGLVVELEARREGDDARVGVPPLAGANLDPDDVDPLHAVVPRHHPKLPHLGTGLQ